MPGIGTQPKGRSHVGQSICIRRQSVPVTDDPDGGERRRPSVSPSPPTVDEWEKEFARKVQKRTKHIDWLAIVLIITAIFYVIMALALGTLFITAPQWDPNIKEQILTAGADEVLVKPFRLKELLDVLERIETDKRAAENWEEPKAFPSKNNP